MAKINKLSTISGNREWYCVYDDSDSMSVTQTTIPQVEAVAVQQVA
jgi:hypothetical protein